MARTQRPLVCSWCGCTWFCCRTNDQWRSDCLNIRDLEDTNKNLITEGPAYNEFGYNEHRIERTDCFCIKIIDSNVKRFGYNICNEKILLHLFAKCKQDPVYFLPPANEVWGKVIFSEACVKNSVHRGGGSASVHAGIPHSPRPGTSPGTGHPPGPAAPQTRHPSGPGTP